MSARQRGQSTQTPIPEVGLAGLVASATQEGWCYQHVQAIIVAIDQYAEKALGNRDFFLNRPHGIGGKGDVI